MAAGNEVAGGAGAGAAAVINGDRSKEGAASRFKLSKSRPPIFLQTSDSDYRKKNLSDLKNVPELIKLADEVLRVICASFLLNPMFIALSQEEYLRQRKFPSYASKYLKREITEASIRLIEPSGGGFNEVSEPIFDLSVRLQKGELTQRQALFELINLCKAKIERDRAEKLTYIERNLKEISNILEKASELRLLNTSAGEKNAEIDTLIVTAKAIISVIKLESADSLTIPVAGQAKGDKKNAELDRVIAQLQSLTIENVHAEYHKKIENVERVNIELVQSEKNVAFAQNASQELGRIIREAIDLKAAHTLEGNRLKLALDIELARVESRINVDSFESDTSRELAVIREVKSEADRQKAVFDIKIAPFDNIILRAKALRERLRPMLVNNLDFKKILIKLGLSAVDQIALVTKPLVEFLTPMREGLFPFYMNISSHEKLFGAGASAHAGQQRGLQRSYGTEDTFTAVKKIVVPASEQLEEAFAKPISESLSVLIQGAINRTKLFIKIDECFGALPSLADNMTTYMAAYYDDKKYGASITHNGIIVAKQNLLQVLLETIYLFELVQDQLVEFDSGVVKQKMLFNIMARGNTSSGVTPAVSNTFSNILRITEKLAIVKKDYDRTCFKNYRDAITYALITADPNKGLATQSINMEDFEFEVPHHPSKNYVNTLCKVFLTIHKALLNKDVVAGDQHELIRLIEQLIIEVNEVAADEAKAFVEFEKKPLEYLEKWLGPLLDYLNTEKVDDRSKKIILDRLRKMHLIDSAGKLCVNIAGLMFQLNVLSEIVGPTSADVTILSDNNFPPTPERATEAVASDSQSFNLFEVFSPLFTRPPSTPNAEMGVTPVPALTVDKSPIETTKSPGIKNAALARLRAEPYKRSDLTTPVATPLISTLNLFNSVITVGAKFGFQNAYLNLLYDFLDTLYARCEEVATEAQKASETYKTLMASICDNRDLTITFMLDQYKEKIHKVEEHNNLKDCYDAWFVRDVDNCVYESQLLEIYKNLPNNQFKIWFINCLHALKINFYVAAAFNKIPVAINFSFKATLELDDATKRDMATYRDIQLIQGIEATLQKTLQAAISIPEFAENDDTDSKSTSTPNQFPLQRVVSASDMLTPSGPSGARTSKVFFGDFMDEAPDTSPGAGSTN